MKKCLTFKLPNALICDDRLTLSARVLAAALYGHRNALGFCKKSLVELSAMTGLSSATVRRAAEELHSAGYVFSARTYRWSKKKQRMVYGKKCYSCALKFAEGYTLVPRTILSQMTVLAPSSFCILLYLCQAAGNTRRAYPSISRISAAVGVARSTVCRALHQLRESPALLVQLCRKVNGAFAASSYHLVQLLGGQCCVQSQQCRSAEPLTLRTLIVKAVRQVRKLFSAVGVVPNLSNTSKDLDNDRVLPVKNRLSSFLHRCRA